MVQCQFCRLRKNLRDFPSKPSRLFPVSSFDRVRRSVPETACPFLFRTPCRRRGGRNQSALFWCTFALPSAHRVDVVRRSRNRRRSRYESGKVTPHNGTIAIVTGHGGALGKNSKGVIPLMRSIVLDHGSTILDIDGDTLTGVMLDLSLIHI